MDHIRDTMQGVPTAIVRRQVAHFYQADPGYGIDVATRMGLSAVDLPARKPPSSSPVGCRRRFFCRA